MNETSSVPNRKSAPYSSARSLSMGSSAFWVMNRRSVGLRSLTCSFSVGTSQASSCPAMDSTDMMAPSGSNCRYDSRLTISSMPKLRTISIDR